jgi:hypothetical protein
VSGTFYAALSTLAPDLDLTSAAVRAGFPPLNPPRVEATAEQIDAAARASIEAFHQAMTVAAGLVAIGGAVSWVGLRQSQPRQRSTEAVPHMTPRDWDARTYDRVAGPMTRWGLDVLDALAACGRRTRDGRRMRHGPDHGTARRTSSRAVT